MVDKQYLESFSAPVNQEERVKQAVRQGMVPLLNVGFRQGHKIYYPLHQMTVTMPAPGDTFKVPPVVAEFILRMFSKRVQPVRGSKPANYTPPPGYKLVPDIEEESTDSEE